jgi:hypothetical protein
MIFFLSLKVIVFTGIYRYLLRVAARMPSYWVLSLSGSHVLSQLAHGFYPTDDDDEMKTKFSKALISFNAPNGSFQWFVLLALIGSGLTQCLQDLNYNDLDF